MGVGGFQEVFFKEAAFNGNPVMKKKPVKPYSRKAFQKRGDKPKSCAVWRTESPACRVENIGKCHTFPKGPDFF